MVMDFKKDSRFLGGIIGLFLPIIVYLFFILIAYGTKSLFSIETSPYLNALRLVSIASNLIVMRYYFVKLKFDYTGRGILLVTFIYVLVYFWIQ
jgi:hypothetical protein